MLLDAMANILGPVSMEQLEEYSRQHPPTRSTCKWCEAGIISTPWFAPSGTFHIVGDGWTHEATESSSCGAEYPYRFAEPAPSTVGNDLDRGESVA